MPTLKIAVRGLGGAEDERAVRQALSDEPGVYGVVVNPREACVEVDYEDDEVGIQRLVAVLRAAGFEAMLAG